MSTSADRGSMARFDAVLFDAGGVLVLPDPTVLAPLLAHYGGSLDHERHRRAHYLAMKAKSDARSFEGSWDVYNGTYVASVDVPDHERNEAAQVLDRTRSAWLWRHRIDDSRVALDRFADGDVPIGVVSNASGQIEQMLAREICQIGDGEHVAMRCIVDSHVVGVAKPDPAIFDHALPYFDGIERSRIAYVGDSVTMDIEGATAAGLHPILLDPYGDHSGAHFERIGSLHELADELV